MRKVRNYSGEIFENNDAIVEKFSKVLELLYEKFCRLVKFWWKFKEVL